MRLEQDKSAIFEELSMRERQGIEQETGRLQALNLDWKAGGRTTAECLQEYQRVLADASAHRLVRLSALEHVAQLLERQEPENLPEMQTLIMEALTEPDVELQNAKLGILGSRLDMDVLFQEESRQGLPAETATQTANAMSVLVKEMMSDPRVPKEFQEFAHQVTSISGRKNNELIERMSYMAYLYLHDREKLWPTLGKFKAEAGGDGGPTVMSPLPALKGMRRLPEGHVPSPEKESQALARPRVGGLAQDQGQVLPLRIFVLGEINGTPYDTGYFSGADARRYIGELRRILMDPAYPDAASRGQARAAAIDRWKQTFWSQLPDQDKAAFGSPDRLILKAETLFNEDALKRALLETLGSEDLQAADPTGGLAESVDRIIASSRPDDDKIREVRALAEHWKRTGQILP